MRLQLARPHVGQRELEAVTGVLESGWLGTGPKVGEFEKAVTDRVHARSAVAVSSGTAALHLALAVSGIGPGDEVLLPSFTFTATAQAVVAAGATPVFTEIDPQTLAMDADEAAGRITKRTRAVIPVHYGGYAEAAAPVAALAAAHDLVLVHDAAHSFGSSSEAGMVGSGPGLTCFSFGPIKPFTCGQGGAVTLGDADLADRLRTAADLGIDRRSPNAPAVAPGFRYRMHDLNAALGLAQLARFDEIAERRRSLWRRYALLLAPIDGLTMPLHDPATMVPFLLAVRVDSGHRDEVRSLLLDGGIETGVHYSPLHHEPFFASCSHDALPVTDQVAAEILTLPFHTGLADGDIDRVADQLAIALRRTDRR